GHGVPERGPVFVRCKRPCPPAYGQVVTKSKASVSAVRPEAPPAAAGKSKKEPGPNVWLFVVTVPSTTATRVKFAGEYAFPASSFRRVTRTGSHSARRGRSGGLRVGEVSVKSIQARDSSMCNGRGFPSRPSRFQSNTR